MNFPCIILERHTTDIKEPYTIEDLKCFSVVRSRQELAQKQSSFIDPVITDSKPVVAEAMKIEQLFKTA